MDNLEEQKYKERLQVLFLISDDDNFEIEEETDINDLHIESDLDDNFKDSDGIVYYKKEKFNGIRYSYGMFGKISDITQYKEGLNNGPHNIYQGDGVLICQVVYSKEKLDEESQKILMNGLMMQVLFEQSFTENQIRSVEMNGVKKKFIDIFKNENKNFNKGDEFSIECQINIHEFSLCNNDLQCLIYKDDETLEGKWDFEKNVSFMKKIINDSGLETEWDHIRCPVDEIYIGFDYKKDDKLLVKSEISIECEVDEDEYEEYQDSDTCIIYDGNIE